jgi:DEAD/DEAH box helicase domain-containing protein
VKERDATSRVPVGSATGLSAVVAALRGDDRLGPQIAHAFDLPGQPAATSALEPALPGPLADALARRGIRELWSHQAEGIQRVREGDNVLVTTPTASGKSLVFHVPVLEDALEGGAGRALFLYPLKALGQDQRSKFLELSMAAGFPASCEIYDGDTPKSLRTKIRKNPPRVVVSNPDMMHYGILGSWTAWEPFLRRLEWIVLDELHTYRGIFGSHFHHVLRRLLRLCHGLGADPRLVASSATAGNAGEFAERLTGESFHWIQGSGAPREGRHLLLVQPESSPYTASLQLLIALLRQGQKTIVFTKARRITELLFKWLRSQEPELARLVASYRAGFLPEERRQIERDLFSGRLRGVISTSALEMGIDVGGLDACILVGYPGSVMATWQRSGRAGREGRESITALVALPDALDQYFLRHPETLVERPFERLVVDPANGPVSRSHLVCAAAERPLHREEDRAYLAAQEEPLAELLADHELREDVDDGRIHPRRKHPHRDVTLRGGGATFAIVDEERGRTIGTVDGVRVLHECHPGAIYLHGGRQYEVAGLDLAEDRVRVRAVDVDWYTSALAEKETEIVSVEESLHRGALSAWRGRLEVTERVVGYERKRIFGQERIDQHELDLQPVTFVTEGLWWAVKPPLESVLRNDERHFLGALHASEHAAISLFPLLALCDRNDIGGISISRHPQVGCGAVFVYDGHPGGVGITAKGFADLPDLLTKVERLLADCECDEGCPSCVQSPKCGNGNRPLDKEGARRSLRLLLGMDACPDPEAEAPWPDPALRGPDQEELAWGGSAAEAGCVVTDLPGAPATVVRPRAEPPLDPDGLPSVAVTPKALAAVGTPGQRTVLFDLETRRSAADVGGWHRIHRMGMALAVVCHLEEDRFEVFTEEQVRPLVSTLRRADLVVGFNLKRFDYRVLSGYTGADYTRLVKTLDLLEDLQKNVGFRVGLDHLSEATVGVAKSADGLQSLEWVKEGRLDLVEQYCRQDVEVMRELYLHGRREGFVCYLDKDGHRLKVPVEW